MLRSKIITNWLTNYRSQSSLGFKFRQKRILPLIEMIRNIYKKKGIVNVIDIGGTEIYWSILPSRCFEENNIYVTLINLPNETKTAKSKRFKYISGDGCNLNMIKNHSYDIAHSNSVIEHVGDWERMVSFANEMKRIAPRYFVQTPNFWFPIEPHCLFPFFHWLPKSLKTWLIMNFQLGHWEKAKSKDQALQIINSVNLLTKKMVKELFVEAKIVTERWLLFSKSFIAIKQ